MPNDRPKPENVPPPPAPPDSLQRFLQYADRADVQNAMAEAAARMRNQSEEKQQELMKQEILRRQQQSIGQAAGVLGGLNRNGRWADGSVTPQDVQATIKKALAAWREGEHSFAVESLSVISQALEGLTKENESLREDRSHLRSENQRLREVNLRLQEQILKRLEDDHET